MRPFMESKVVPLLMTSLMPLNETVESLSVYVPLISKTDLQMFLGICIGVVVVVDGKCVWLEAIPVAVRSAVNEGRVGH